MTILLLQADTTQTLPIAKSLKRLGFTVDIVVSSKWTYGYGSKYVATRYIFKDYENIDEYYVFVKDILIHKKYDLIIPMADQGAILLSKYKDELLELSQFIMPDYLSFENGFDKHKLMAKCEELNLPHPKTIIVESDKLTGICISDLKFPVLIKPNHSCGARGITYIETPDELLDKFSQVVEKYGECHIQEFIPSGGAQVEVQLYINAKQELVQSSVIYKYRWYPNKGGSSCCNKSVENPKIVNICHQILKSINWVGFADFDTIEDPRTGELLIMELNPRVPACVKTAFESGIDWGDIISSEYLGKPHKHYSHNREIYLRHLGFEILWFLNANNRLSTKPSWFKFFGSNIFYQDMNGWSDPKAFIYGTLGNICKQLSPSFRQAKSGI